MPLTSSPEIDAFLTLWGTVLEREISHHTPGKTLLPLPLPNPFICKNITGTPQSLLSSSLRTSFILGWRPSLRTQESLGKSMDMRAAAELFSSSLLSHLSPSHPSRLASYPTSSQKTSFPSQNSTPIIANSALIGCIITFQVCILLPLKGKPLKG